MDNVFFRFVNFPKGVYGCTVVNPDNSFEVYINRNLCPKKQKEVAKHELKHIGLNHFYITSLIADIEFLAG